MLVSVVRTVVPHSFRAALLTCLCSSLVVATACDGEVSDDPEGDGGAVGALPDDGGSVIDPRVDAGLDGGMQAASPRVGCRPCAGDDECYGGLCASLAEGTFCFDACDDDACGDGYACGEVEGRSVCVPETGSCWCSPSTTGLVRACLQENDEGTCFGTESCAADGWTTCSASTPHAESCDGVDENCNGLVDELPAPSEACESTNGFGTCTGDWSCEGAAGWRCGAATPAAEVCDGVDNNCDGAVDEDWREAGSGAYMSDTACGDCSVDCTANDSPSATWTCDATGEPTCVFSCQAGFLDVDGLAYNGCEHVTDVSAIYVSTTDASAADDDGCGLGPSGADYPCDTIAQGLARAVQLGRGVVRVADGSYDEAILLVDGIDVLGGHDPGTWVHDPASSRTFLRGSTALGVHRAAVVAAGISLGALLEGFVVTGPTTSAAGANTYGIYVTGSTVGLVLRNNVIEAGIAGAGEDGATGSSGQNGADGAGRTAANAASYDGFVTSGAGFCNASNNRQHANGGQRTCGIDVVSGGQGGGNRCSPAAFNEYSGLDGVSGQPAVGGLGGPAGAGGDAGDDANLENTTCVIPAAPMVGATGTPGDDGAAGSGGLGCQDARGSVVGGHWTAGAAQSGALGGNGGGGGGGGAGGGAFCYSCPDNKDRLGGHGGGGGSGGCGGNGGASGSAGGGSFGLFVVGGEAPTVTNNVFLGGVGGSGGRGGVGGVGGERGRGGAGGLLPNGFCGGKAEAGGDGGSGGAGGGGGGGCGGASVAIYTTGVGAPAYCIGDGNVFHDGVAGAGGVGGPALSPGSEGLGGVEASCLFD